MIHLFFDMQKVRQCGGFEELLEYFNGFENSKIVDYNSYYGQEKWNFIYHRYKKPSNLYEHRKNEDFMVSEGEFFEAEFDLIEMYTGDSERTYQISVTPDVDVIELMREWCLAYCEAHGYRVLELINGYRDLERPKSQVWEHDSYDTFQKDKSLTITQSHNHGQ